MPEEPLVSIVTPSYNMAAFLTDTIESVLSQDYGRIEYIVMDACSTDGTIEILERYKDRVRWFSSPDDGPADALNRGFGVARGSIFAWLNADDTYLPGAVSAAVQSLLSDPGLGAVYGGAYWVDRQGEILREYPTRAFDPELLSRECYICQPACFARANALEKAGMLDPALKFAFDYDLWIRMSRACRFGTLDRHMATSRMHSSNITLGQRTKVFEECMAIVRRHFGYVPFQWVYSYCCYLVDRRDQFYEPLEPSIFKYLFSLPAGCWQNRGHMSRYVAEWAAVMSVPGLIRLWKRGPLARAFSRRK